MKKTHLGHIILFGTFILACLMIVQIYWFKKAFNVSERQFDHTVQLALKKVADSMTEGASVSRLSSNFFFVNTESALDDLDLDHRLQLEFLKRKLDVEYELGIYDADDDTLVYGNYVKATREPIPITGEPRWSHTEKNFAVYFPWKTSYVAAQLNIWIFSTLMLLLMTGFFAYAIYSLLRERKFAGLKSDFINNMTHEFKTPVTNIKIAGEILKNKIDAQAGLDVYVDILLKENEKLRQKIDQVLLGSSIDHFARPALEIVDAHRIIADCADAFQLKVQERNGVILLRLQAESSTILADRERLTQAINNVIDNAEKYSPRNPHIIVETKNCTEGIEIRVVDQGIGIAPEMKRKVFEKFFRIRSGDQHTVKGFGLGLSFVKHVVRSHRGSVQLLSALNQGTAVTITLPKA